MSPVWARMSDKRGRKPMVVLGMAGFAVSMLGFGFFILMGLKGLMVPLAVFAGAALSRAIFGLVGSASNPGGPGLMSPTARRRPTAPTPWRPWPRPVAWARSWARPSRRSWSFRS